MKQQRPKGVPDTARLSMLYNALDFIKTANALLKPHGLRLRTKASQRGGGVPSWVWIEETGTPPVVPIKPVDWEGLNKHLASMGLPSK